MITVDKNAAYPKAFNELKAEGYLSEPCELRQVNYLNTLIEQDHRFVKRLTKPGVGFFSDLTAWRTLQGFEAMNMIRKGQIHGVEKGDVQGQVALLAKLFGVVASGKRYGSSLPTLFPPYFLQHNQEYRFPFFPRVSVMVIMA